MKSVLGGDGGQLVTVRGQLKRDKSGNLTVVARGMFIQPESPPKK